VTHKFPKIKSYQQEAEFWDNHDASDYFDKSHQVTLNFSQAPSSTLTRMWVIEKLKSLNAI
jgi:hypothetical protein